MRKTNKTTRRRFLDTAAKATAGLTILPVTVISGCGHKAPSDKLNIAAVGLGGVGFRNLKEMETDNIIALCDVDWNYSQRSFDSFPNARKYKDWRKMYDELGKSIDAVFVATPDHTHAVITSHAMTMGKHVYTQKPLTHSVYESRLLARLARKYKVATQMGNQGASGEGVNLMTEWISNGEIGEVTKVESFTTGPSWPQGLNPPTEGQLVPGTLDWDLFVGPAKMRPYNEAYHPWTWRGWWDYGTGTLGDQGCHILHPVFASLELGYPAKVQVTSTLLLNDSAPNAQSVRFTFPARKPEKKMKINLPAVEVYWYDGGIKPMLPVEWPAERNLHSWGSGVIFHGSKDTLICGGYGNNPWLLSGRVPDAPRFRRRIDTSKQQKTLDTEKCHVQDWIRACKESPGSRIETASPFNEAGPFNEIVALGVMAVRLQALYKELEWDGENMEFTNLKDDETIKTVIKSDFKYQDRSFYRTWTDPVPAKQFAAELIRHTYRAPWSLPEMPE